MERFDAIVIGAGPAGSTTAHRLAEAGARVLVVDKARFPRDKPCGGGLTLRAVRQLPVDPSPVVEDAVEAVQLRLGFERSFERRARGPVILMTQRRRLDHFLLEQAAERGAEVREGVRVDAVDADERSATVRVDGVPIRADVLIGADGANGTTARAAGLAPDFDWGVAYEGNVHGAQERYRHRAVVELGVVPGGYGWVFPKEDHVNVGVGGWLREGPRLKEQLRRVARAHRLDEVTGLRGHRLPMRRPSSPLARGRVLLVGDAAGLVDPLSGDGMYECFVSSRLASAAVLDLLGGEAPSLDPYATALNRELAHHLAASWGVKLALDRYPGSVFAILRVPGVFGAIERILRGELSHPGAARGLVRAPLRALALLARASGSPGETYKAEALV